MRDSRSDHLRVSRALALTSWLSFAACIALPAALAPTIASAQTVTISFDDGGTHNTSDIDYGALGLNPNNDSVDVEALDSVGGFPTTVMVDDDVLESVYVRGTSHMELVALGYVLNGATAYDDATLDWHAVDVGGNSNLQYFGNSSGEFSMGWIFGMYVWDTASFVQSGGAGGSLTTRNSGLFEMTGGQNGVTDGVTARNESEIQWSGGTMHGFVRAFDQAQIVWSGGQMGSGPGAPCGSDEQTCVLGAFDTSTLTIDGHSFAVNGVPVPTGTLSAMGGNLSGTLDDGTLFDTPFSRSATAVIQLPEPGFGASLLAGGLFLATRARRRT